MERTATPAPPGAPAPEELSGVGSALEGFLASSEGVFLEAGSHLANLERRARTMLEAARAAVEHGASESPVDQLDRELVRLEAYLGRARASCEAGLAALGRLPCELEPVLAAVSGYETIPPTLRMLGMNTRIENARATAQNGGMETVASEVRRLADLVEPRFHAVARDTQTVLEFAHRARASAEAFLARQLASSAELLAETRRALEALRALSAAGRAVAHRAVAASERLGRDVAAVLVALQAHDATRQAIEHVIAELGTLAREPEHLASPADARGAAATSYRILPAQLRGAREHFVGALDEIQTHLRDLSAQGAELRQHAQQLAIGEAGRAPLQDVARAVAGATGLLRSHVAFEEDAARALRRVTQTVEAVATSVRDIQGIGSAIRIIALNALVETERAGSGGRVLAVLAQGMGGVAADVVRRTEAASRALTEVSRLAAALVAASAPADLPGAAIAAALEELGAALDGHHRTLQRSLEALHLESGSLEQEVDGIARHLDEQRAAARSLAQLEDRLAALAQEAFAGGRPDASGAGRAYARYTMESERSIHDRALGWAGPAPARSPGQGDLGSNVELF